MNLVDALQKFIADNEDIIRRTQLLIDHIQAKCEHDYVWRETDKIGKCKKCSKEVHL